MVEIQELKRKDGVWKIQNFFERRIDEVFLRDKKST